MTNVRRKGREKKRERGALCAKSCVRVAENYLAWYVWDHNEDILKLVKLHRDSKIILQSLINNYKNYRKAQQQAQEETKRINWLQKHLAMAKKVTQIVVLRRWFAVPTSKHLEPTISSTILKKSQNHLWVGCDQKTKNVSHIVSKSSQLAQQAYKKTHNKCGQVYATTLTWES